MSRQAPCTASPCDHRATVVGPGARAQLFTEALAGPCADRIELVGCCDVNAHRMAVFYSDGAGGESVVRDGDAGGGAGGAGRLRGTAGNPPPS